MNEAASSRSILHLPTQRESQAAMIDMKRLWQRHVAAWAGDALVVRASGLAEMRWSRENDFDEFYDLAAMDAV
jgi:hypothetical protein